MSDAWGISTLKTSHVIESKSWPQFNGRNIKIRRDLPVNLKMKIYDNLYRKMQKLLDQYDPCDKKLMDDLSIKCASYGKISACCGRCTYLTHTGCKTKNLACKLHLCHEACQILIKKYPKVTKRWELWKLITAQLDMWSPWVSRQRLQNHLKECARGIRKAMPYEGH